MWMPERGIGYLDIPDPAAAYDAAYFARFAGYAGSAISDRLIAARLELVGRHWGHGPLIDVGCGAGTFIAARNAEVGRPVTTGWDINPASLAWLDRAGLRADPYEGAAAVSMWDVLEHIAEFDELLAAVRHAVFVCLPIFRDLQHVLGSRHYRPDEHCWYFTETGFLAVMRRLGWRCLERSRDETAAGRDGIGSYAFGRED